MVSRKEYEAMHMKVFMELLRAYNAGVGVTHGANPLNEVTDSLFDEASAITDVYFSRLTTKDGDKP